LDLKKELKKDNFIFTVITNLVLAIFAPVCRQISQLLKVDVEFTFEIRKIFK